MQRSVDDKISTTAPYKFLFLAKIIPRGVENFISRYGVATRDRWIFHFSFLLGIEMEQRLHRSEAGNNAEAARGQVKFSRSIEHGSRVAHLLIDFRNRIAVPRPDGAHPCTIN